MTKPILQYWKNLRRRAILLLVSEAGIQLLVLSGVLVFGAAVGFSAKLSYEIVMYSALLVFAVWQGWQLRSFAHQWNFWSKRQAIAERVEQLVPSLAGRTLLVLDDNPRNSFCAVCNTCPFRSLCRNNPSSTSKTKPLGGMAKRTLSGFFTPIVSSSTNCDSACEVVSV